jgi:hypothetical protein
MGELEVVHPASASAESTGPLAAVAPAEDIEERYAH